MSRFSTGRYVSLMTFICILFALAIKLHFQISIPWILQETAISFIDRMSSDYSEYVDITQPIQVSVYEMKLGLSLFVSGALLGKLLNRFDIDMVDSVMVIKLVFQKCLNMSFRVVKLNDFMRLAGNNLCLNEISKGLVDSFNYLHRMFATSAPFSWCRFSC